jgi:hypothetical protein
LYNSSKENDNSYVKTAIDMGAIIYIVADGLIYIEIKA